MRALRLTPRDLALFGSLLELRMLSVHQIQRLYFPSRQTTTRRLRVLDRQRQVRVLRIPGLIDQVVVLSQAGAQAWASYKHVPFGELSWSAKRRTPRDYLFVQHALGIGDFRIALEEAVKEQPGLGLRGFLADHHGTRGTGQRLQRRIQGTVSLPGGALRHRPDAVFCLARGSQSVLFFLEVDRGTEVLTHPDKGVLKLLRFYLACLTSGNYQRFGQEFEVSEPFRGFRTLLVTSSGKRLANIRRAGQRLDSYFPKAKRFIWLATQEALKENGLSKPSWVSLDPNDSTRYTLIPQDS